MTRFLDTDILLRHLVPDDQEKALACRALLLRLERGQETVVTSDLVIFETVFVLQSPQQYGLSRERVCQLLEPLVNLRGLRLPRKSLYSRVFDIFRNSSVSFADAYNAAYMEARGLNEVYSYDSDFDRVPGITRVEPEG